MTIQHTHLEGCFTLLPKVFGDERGSFCETYNAETFKAVTGMDVHFVQDNQSVSSRGVLRGLHFQTGAMAQAKLVRVISGRGLDVAVDIRKDSPTYGQYATAELTGENNLQFFVPRGFAHGFITLSERAVFAYKCDNFYDKASEGGIIYNDPDLGIDWGISEQELIVSEKDLQLPLLRDLKL